MIRITRYVAASAVAAASLLTSIAVAAELDPRALYSNKCGSCHFESGPDMANLKMSLKGDALIVNSTGAAVE